MWGGVGDGRVGGRGDIGSGSQGWKVVAFVRLQAEDVFVQVLSSVGLVSRFPRIWRRVPW